MPVLYLYQDWMLGVLVLRVWVLAMTVGAPSSLADVRPLPAAAPISWRARLECLMRMPLRRLPFSWTLHAIIWPLLRVRTLKLVPHLHSQQLYAGPLTRLIVPLAGSTAQCLGVRPYTRTHASIPCGQRRFWSTDQCTVSVPSI